jgi:hypothetical protein
MVYEICRPMVRIHFRHDDPAVRCGYPSIAMARRPSAEGLTKALVSRSLYPIRGYASPTVAEVVDRFDRVVMRARMSGNDQAHIEIDAA